jgi:hypothetical protein
MYRTGRSVGRTIYQVQPDGSDRLVGMLDTRELAQDFVDAINARVAAQVGLCGWFMTAEELDRREAAAYERGRAASAVTQRSADVGAGHVPLLAGTGDSAAPSGDPRPRDGGDAP